jgi:hypothetical protein
MMRRRWIYRGCEAIEVGDDYVPDARSVQDSILWNDRAYQDMGDPRFASRKQHQEYMKQQGLTTASDYHQQWRKQEEQRNKVNSGYDPSRKEHVSKAIHKLTGA